MAGWLLPVSLKKTGCFGNYPKKTI